MAPHWALAAVALSALVPLAVTASAAPARATAGAFATLTVMPALQALVAAFFGTRAALAVGATVALLTMGLVLGPPPALAVPEIQWRAALGGSDVLAVSTLAAPRSSAAAEALRNGGRALLYVCLSRGGPDDVEVRLSEVPLAHEGVSSPGECWQTYAVPAATVKSEPLEATVKARPGASAELVGGFSRRRPGGEAPGGAALLIGGRRERIDLSPTTPGTQTGRFFVELRVFAAHGRLVEIWF